MTLPESNFQIHVRIAPVRFSSTAWCTRVAAALTALVALGPVACDGGGGETSDGETAGEPIVYPEDAQTFDATDYDNWVYLDLETDQLVTPATPEDSDEWDMAFQRFNIAVNGGTSGTGEVAVARLDDAVYEDVTVAPADGYITDNVVDPVGGMEDIEPGYAFDLWFDYDMDEHTLSPTGRVYVVRTVEQNYFKVEVIDYYDQAGTAGHVTSRIAAIDAPMS